MAKNRQSWPKWRSAAKTTLDEYFWPSLADVVLGALEKRTDPEADTARWEEDMREVLDEYVEDFLNDIMMNEIDATYTHDLAALAAG